MNPLECMEQLINEVRDADKDCPTGVRYALATYLGSLEDCDEGYEEWMYEWANDVLDMMGKEECKFFPPDETLDRLITEGYIDDTPYDMGDEQ